VFEQLRNYSQAQLILKRKVVACRKNFVILKANTRRSQENAGSTVANDTKNAPRPPKFL